MRVTRRDGRATTLTFDWLAYAMLLRERTLTGRQFNQLGQAIYCQLEARGSTRAWL